MEITVGALLLGMGPHIRRLNRKCHSLGMARAANRRSRLRYVVCKAMQVLLTQYCLMLLYLGHLVRQCNWSAETANTGVLASAGLQIVMCLLDRLNMGSRLLKYERTVAIVLLCHTAWHSAIPGQALAEEFCESLLSNVVTKKGQNRGAVIIEDVDDLYHLITIRKEGHRVNVWKISKSFVNSVRQRLTAYLNAKRVYVPWVRWCAERTCAIQAYWPRRGVPSFPPSSLIAKGSNHYKQVLVSVLLVLTQQGPLKARFKRNTTTENNEKDHTPCHKTTPQKENPTSPTGKNNNKTAQHNTPQVNVTQRNATRRTTTPQNTTPRNPTPNQPQHNTQHRTPRTTQCNTP